MPLQMALLEQKMKAEDRLAEKIAGKLIRLGLSSSDINEVTNFPLEKIQQLAHDNPDD